MKPTVSAMYDFGVISISHQLCLCTYFKTRLPTSIPYSHISINYIQIVLLCSNDIIIAILDNHSIYPKNACLYSQFITICEHLNEHWIYYYFYSRYTRDSEHTSVILLQYISVTVLNLSSIFRQIMHLFGKTSKITLKRQDNYFGHSNLRLNMFILILSYTTYRSNVITSNFHEPRWFSFRHKPIAPST